MTPADPGGGHRDASARLPTWVMGVAIFMLPAIVYSIRDRSAGVPLAEAAVAKLRAWHVLAEPPTTAPISRELREQLLALRSSVGEERVQASRWIASRCERRALWSLVQAMEDPETLRPCQLAKSLGALADPRAIPALEQASLQSQNLDLAVCATLALGDSGRPEATDALVRAYLEGPAALFALEGLGRVDSVAAIPFLRAVAAAAPDRDARRVAQKSLARLRLLEMNDPVPGLLAVCRASAGHQRLDSWALRNLARLADPRAVAPLGEIAERHPEPVVLAALLAHGAAGRDTVRRLALRSEAHRSEFEAALTIPGAAIGSVRAWEDHTGKRELFPSPTKHLESDERHLAPPPYSTRRPDPAPATVRGGKWRN